MLCYIIVEEFFRQ